MEKKRRKIETLIKESYVTIGYSPCKIDACGNGGVCSDQIMVYESARITDSPALILTSSKVMHEMVCKCRDGFTGDRCEKKQDPCAPNPCQSVSSIILFVLFDESLIILYIH